MFEAGAALLVEGATVLFLGTALVVIRTALRVMAASSPVLGATFQSTEVATSAWGCERLDLPDARYVCAGAGFVEGRTFPSRGMPRFVEGCARFLHVATCFVSSRTLLLWGRVVLVRVRELPVEGSRGLQRGRRRLREHLAVRLLMRTVHLEPIRNRPGLQIEKGVFECKRLRAI